ncbi:unnamed protein product, partial [Symbiodinium microadriaticum]
KVQKKEEEDEEESEAPKPKKGSAPKLAAAAAKRKVHEEEEEEESEAPKPKKGSAPKLAAAAAKKKVHEDEEEDEEESEAPKSKGSVPSKAASTRISKKTSVADLDAASAKSKVHQEEAEEADEEEREAPKPKKRAAPKIAAAGKKKVQKQEEEDEEESEAPKPKKRAAPKIAAAAKRKVQKKEEEDEEESEAPIPKKGSAPKLAAAAKRKVHEEEEEEEEDEEESEAPKPKKGSAPKLAAAAKKKVHEDEEEDEEGSMEQEDTCEEDGSDQDEKAIVNVFKSDIATALRDAELGTSCWEEPWYNLAARVFANDDDFGDDLRTLPHYEAQLFPKVERFLNMAMDRHWHAAPQCEPLEVWDGAFTAKCPCVIIFLVLLVWWLDVSPDTGYQFLDYFSGKARLALMAEAAGYKVQAYDIAYGVQRAKKRGRIAVSLILRSKLDHLVAAFGVVCSSFVPVNRGTSKRSYLCPRGDENVVSVRKGNKLMAREYTFCYARHFVELLPDMFAKRPMEYTVSEKPLIDLWNETQFEWDDLWHDCDLMDVIRYARGSKKLRIPKAWRPHLPSHL